MYFNDEFYYYNHISKLVVTQNYCKRVIIGVKFSVSEERSVTLLLDGNVLQMLKVFEIELENQCVLDYIVSNKASAFKQIYNKAYLSRM